MTKQLITSITDIRHDTKRAIIRAVESAIPCLCDWCQSTGFGEVYRRDVSALRDCLKALDALRDENAEYGILSAGSSAWPIALSIVRDWEQGK